MSSSANPDVIIVGSGQAGVPLATRLAAAGKQVLIVERGAAGGTCVNVGCTPTKTMVASARAAHVARTAARFGVLVDKVEVDFAAVVARKAATVKRWREGVLHHLAAAGDRLRFVHGHARFVTPRSIEVNGERYQSEQIVINVGARPAIPKISGLLDVPYLTSSSLLEQRALPRHLLVAGAGYIACEMGQMFRRFGAEVTIVAPSPRVLPREDPAVSEAIAQVFKAEGIQLELGKAIEQVARTAGDDSVELRLGAGEGGATLRGTHLLIATGRSPNTDDLGCEVVGLQRDAHGYLEVDERYESSLPGVFAVGDCVPGPQFTHVSWDDHRVLFEILSGRTARARTARLVPYTIFTDPQVAGVGLSERAAREQGIAVEVASMPFGSIARAIETDETAGVVKVVIDSASEQIVGASIVGVDAGELIHVFSVLMQAGASARNIVDAEFVHPTFAEGLQTAVMKLPRYALS
jgi:pyruvate/2-oxoglutarate dehydrogenase complex dihydrolipoamide dehydrogenase (E3) component